MPETSMLKYFQDQGGPETGHGDKLHWPGTADGYPFRGGIPPNLRQDEFEALPVRMDYHSRLFHLWAEDEKKNFDEIMDRIVNGWYMQHKRVDQWDTTNNGLTVWLEWVQIYGEQPNGKTPGSSHDAADTYTFPLAPGGAA
jgi:hypothetical protein